MARNHKFYFDPDRTPRARGPAAERLLMHFLETDVQGSDHVCHDLMDDLVAIEDGTDEQREFIGNAHRVTIDAEGVTITCLAEDGTSGNGPAGQEPPGGEVGDHPGTGGETPAGMPTKPAATDPAHVHVAGNVYRTARKHFREVLEDWEAFILDDDPIDDPLLDDD